MAWNPKQAFAKKKELAAKPRATGRIFSPETKLHLEVIPLGGIFAQYNLGEKKPAYAGAP